MNFPPCGCEDVALLKPNIQARPSQLRSEPADPGRNVYCLHYAGCLDHAVSEGWDNWTCSRCPLKGGTGQKPSAYDFAHDRRRGMD
jgi:hypothetical protein